MIAAVKVMLPVKPPLGVTVIVDTFPEVAPGATVTVVPAMVYVGTAVPVPLRLTV